MDFFMKKETFPGQDDKTAPTPKPVDQLKPRLHSGNGRHHAPPEPAQRFPVLSSSVPPDAKAVSDRIMEKIQPVNTDIMKLLADRVDSEAAAA